MFYDRPDITTQLLFYPVPDTNEPCVPTVFMPRWDELKENWVPDGVGVLPWTWQIYKGVLPLITNGPPIGTEDQFLNGFSYADWEANNFQPPMVPCPCGVACPATEHGEACCTYKIIFSGGTGDFFIFNGSWLVQHHGFCQWNNFLVTDPVEIVLDTPGFLNQKWGISATRGLHNVGYLTLDVPWSGFTTRTDFVHQAFAGVGIPPSVIVEPVL
jgi:hypothetical protein